MGKPHLLSPRHRGSRRSGRQRRDWGLCHSRRLGAICICHYSTHEWSCALQCNPPPEPTKQSDITQYSTVSTVYSTVQYSTVQYSTVLGYKPSRLNKEGVLACSDLLDYGIAICAGVVGTPCDCFRIRFLGSLVVAVSDQPRVLYFNIVARFPHRMEWHSLCLTHGK